MLSSSMMHAIRLAGKVFLSHPHSVQLRSRHHTHFVRVPAVAGQYLLLNLSTPARMDGCGLRAPKVEHVDMMY